MSIKCKKSGRIHDSDEEHRKERNVRSENGKAHFSVMGWNSEEQKGLNKEMREADERESDRYCPMVQY